MIRGQHVYNRFVLQCTDIELINEPRTEGSEINIIQCNKEQTLMAMPGLEKT